MNSSDLFYKRLKDKSTFLYDTCNLAIKKLTDEKRKQLKYVSNFQAIQIGENLFIKEPILKKINQQFKIKYAGLLIMDRNMGYDFHVDAQRKVTINMLISSGKSHSIFKKDHINEQLYQFEELVFDKKSFYLYNTSREHSVINLDQPRYMFTIRFDNLDLTYDEVYKWCESNDLF